MHRRREVGSVFSVPSLEAQPVTLVLFERRGIEDADRILVHTYRRGAFPGRAPVKRVYVLQDGESTFRRQQALQHLRKVARREVRLAEQNYENRLRMLYPKFGD